MKLLDILKQFKTIEPDANFSAISKRAILAQGEIASAWSTRRFIVRLFETGIAVALTGFFIFLLTGAFSGSTLAPVQLSAMDPASLHAEAQAIDMQIRLANVSYEEGSAAESTAATVKPQAAMSTLPAVIATGTAASIGATDASSTAASSTETSTLTIDQALQSLSQ